MNVHALFFSIFLSLALLRIGHAQGETWKWINPEPMGSHLFGVAAISETMVAVGSHGTILRSGDSGKAWTPIEHGLTESWLRAVALADSAYGLAVGDGGAVLKTQDTGRTWQNLAVPIHASWSSLAIKGKTGIMAGFRFDLLRSGDAGRIWTKPSLPDGTLGLRGVTLVHPGMAVAVGDSGIIMRSLDSGKTWSLVRPAQGSRFLSAVGFKNSLSGFAMGEEGFSLATRDGGATWTEASSPNPVGIGTISFLDSLNGVITGYDSEIHITSDGGSTWTPGYDGDEFGVIFASAFAGGNTGVAIRTMAVPPGRRPNPGSPPKAFIPWHSRIPRSPWRPGRIGSCCAAKTAARPGPGSSTPPCISGGGRWPSPTPASEWRWDGTAS